MVMFIQGQYDHRAVRELRARQNASALSTASSMGFMACHAHVCIKKQSKEVVPERRTYNLDTIGIHALFFGRDNQGLYFLVRPAQVPNHLRSLRALLRGRNVRRSL